MMSDKIKNIDKWNEVKKRTEQENIKVYFKERDIFWTRLGENIGFEQNGKGEQFQRPILVVRRYTNDMFLGVPLSTTKRDGSFFFQFSFLENQISTALLVQHKLYSKKRLLKKIGMINKDDFENLKIKLHDLVFGENFCSSKKKSDPEGNCTNIITKNINNSKLSENSITEDISVVPQMDEKTVSLMEKLK